MRRVLLQPRWLPWHLALVVVLVAFVLLGDWQLDSYRGAGERPAVAAGPAVPLDRVAAPGGRLTGAEVGRRVTVRGTYAAEHQLLVPGRGPGEADGFRVVTPLETDQGVAAVTRGWVARTDDPAARVPAGEVRVSGVLEPSESAGDSLVDPLDVLPTGQVPYASTVTLLDALPYSPDELYDGQLLLTAQQPASVPAPEPVQAPERGGGVARWRNLAYGLQWWLFAGAAVFFWWVVLRRAAAESQAGAEATEVEPVGPARTP